LLLQPLIENAIKYAISPSEQGGRITIEANTDAHCLWLSVGDDGPGLIETQRIENGRGVGLRNTCERLRAMYGAAATIEFINSNPGLRVRMRIPKSGVVTA
jgi:sensor histidine kinase YesM